ncbi:MAG: hypothetical protein ACLQMO_09155, partial [Acidobacteriaceae bacterium]
FLFLAIAIQPAIAQQDQATHVFHRLIPAGDTCSTCHKAVYDQWKASPHSANGHTPPYGRWNRYPRLESADGTHAWLDPAEQWQVG